MSSGQIGLVVCRGCCCGSPSKHPGTDHASQVHRLGRLARQDPAVAPGLFRSHIRRVVGPVPQALAHHLGEALARTLLVSLAVAVLAALLTTLAVSAFIRRQHYR